MAKQPGKQPEQLIRVTSITSEVLQFESWARPPTQNSSAGGRGAAQCHFRLLR